MEIMKSECPPASLPLVPAVPACIVSFRSDRLQVVTHVYEPCSNPRTPKQHMQRLNSPGQLFSGVSRTLSIPLTHSADQCLSYKKKSRGSADVSLDVPSYCSRRIPESIHSFAMAKKNFVPVVLSGGSVFQINLR